MLTRAVLVLFLLALVRASKLSLQLQARQDLCDSQGGDGYCNRVCGDIYLPVSQFCCGTVPASSFYYESSIGQVCNDYCINNNDYLARYSNGTWSCDVATPFPSTSPQVRLQHKPQARLFHQRLAVHRFRTRAMAIDPVVMFVLVLAIFPRYKFGLFMRNRISMFALRQREYAYVL